MKTMILGLIVAGLVAGGCAAKAEPKKTGIAGMSMDVSAPPPTPQYAPAAGQPVVYEAAAQPVTPALEAPADETAAAAPAPTAASATAGAAGHKYTVKKGDTLWRIAETQYGNGNKWQKIAMANPGLSPETLKAGQKITLP